MKISCDIIQDLLPLYCDGVCSQDSKQVVEAHLQDCEKCSADAHAAICEVSTQFLYPKSHFQNSVLFAWISQYLFLIHGVFVFSHM